MQKTMLIFSILFIVGGCATKMFSNDPYAVGLRWYERGDYARAEQYWKPLAEQGDCDAQFRYGMIFWQKNFKQNPKFKENNRKALSLWRKSANQGHPKAQGALGDLYFDSKEVYIRCPKCGVRKDLAHAYMWYELAKESAVYDNYKEYLRRTSELLMTEIKLAQVNQGKIQKKTWRPKPQKCTPRKLL